MKWFRVFLLICLIPSLNLAAFDEGKYDKKLAKIQAEWDKAREFCKEIKELDELECQKREAFLRQAIDCCESGVKICNQCLKKISKLWYFWRETQAWIARRNQCETYKRLLRNDIDALKKHLDQVLSYIAFEKAKVWYREGEKKASLASFKESSGAQRRFDNQQEIILELQQTATLYEEAARHVNEGLVLISPYPDLANSQVVLKETLEKYQNLANQYKKASADWPAKITAQKAKIEEHFLLLKEQNQLLEEKGFKRSALRVKKEIISILEHLSEKGEKGYEEELLQLKNAISNLEEKSFLTGLQIPSQQEKKDREVQFFKNQKIFNLGILAEPFLPNTTPPFVFALDGQRAIYRNNLKNRDFGKEDPQNLHSERGIIAERQGPSENANSEVNPTRPKNDSSGYFGIKKEEFILYTDQFYRFLVQSDTPVSHLLIKVYENETVVHEETIDLPLKKGLAWQNYVTKDGLIFIPETQLKTEFGLDLQIIMVPDPKYPFSFIISQKVDRAHYRISVLCDETKPLYTCQSFLSPPWQLEMLKKPSLPVHHRLAPKSYPLVSCFADTENCIPHLLENINYPALDLLVEQLKGDPLLIAQYVYHEIAFIQSGVYQKNDVFYPAKIHRNAYTTYLEKQGSPWEQCLLLVYLLRKAGYRAEYAIGAPYFLPKAFVEKLWLTEVADEQVHIQYPWVVFFDGKEWISLFPWMKELQIHEGYDVYSLLPEEYASADRWVLRYLKSDPNILNHIKHDKDDTAGTLFVRFVEEELRKKNLSLTDVGIQSSQIKKQFSSWEDFPRPFIRQDLQTLLSLTDDMFAYLKIKFCPRGSPEAVTSFDMPLALLSPGISPIRISPAPDGHLRIYYELENPPRVFDLPVSCSMIDIMVGYGLDSNSFLGQSLSLTQDTHAVFCVSLGGTNDKITSLFYEKFSEEKDEEKRLHSLLALVGSSYFERCDQSERRLASLHKMTPTSLVGFGLSKLLASSSSQDSKLPQVDMIWFSRSPFKEAISTSWHQEKYNNFRQFQVLTTVDSSSNEHHVLHQVFNDASAISTVKLLQLAHLEHEKKGLPDAGFLTFSESSFEKTQNAAEEAHGIYFPHLKEFNLHAVPGISWGQWEALRKLISSDAPFHEWTYAYMTPGLVLSPNGVYREMGTLILHPNKQAGLISSKQLLLHGGLGSPFYCSPFSVQQWQLIQDTNAFNTNFYKVQTPFSATPPTLVSSPKIETPLPTPSTRVWTADVRERFKAFVNTVADPVDVVTGAFYINELDLAFSGPFPLEIRRNYNSQNPLVGDFGCGWKLGLNPYLIEQDDKLYAAEIDGTVVAYSYNTETSRWEVFPENNPELSNFNRQGIGSTANPFQAYIENDILYGADGSKRIFENGLLQKWIDCRGNELTFSYTKNMLSRIESSNNDFCGFLYNHEGKISEVYAKDGRRIYYHYNVQGDLTRVTLPNTAVIYYEYDESHRMIQETKPHGKVLKNRYKDGKVQEQLSPMGPEQQMIVTASFDYQEGLTTVKDAKGGTTIYKIFQNQIYKIVDPLGYKTLQSWFIDEKSWFDPETEQIVAWDGPGAFLRSLKSSTDKRGLNTHYFYDSRGNPIQIKLQGKDLTGNGRSFVTKKLTYNERNLCEKQEVLNQKTITIYDSIFAYLPKRIEKYSDDTLISYLDFTYNQQGLVEKEDSSGSIVLWEYDCRGFASKKIELTGTEDPDVISTYTYNNQGQCIRATAPDQIEEKDYDIMGNTIQSRVFSPSGSLISANYIGYNLNSEPIWKQTANPQNTLHIDYHASGAIKATRQTLSPGSCVAYTLYEYDPRGYLTEETDSLGYTTYRSYNALGKVISETKEGVSTLFTYEPGGLVEEMISSSGAKRKRSYTTNGLLKEEIYPDGTKNSVIYDFFGRPTQETKNGITWQITYDDVHRQVIRTHAATKLKEIQEFDAKGNLIQWIDASGHTFRKTYDALNRLKTETTPSGQQTLWNYEANKVICTFANGEKKIEHYEAGRLAEIEVFDSQGALIQDFASVINPKTDMEVEIEGEEITTTWKNVFGLPVKVQKGDTATFYEYDSCGNCTQIIDGDGRVTSQTFDGLRRITEKNCQMAAASDTPMTWILI